MKEPRTNSMIPAFRKCSASLLWWDTGTFSARTKLVQINVQAQGARCLTHIDSLAVECCVRGVCLFFL